MLKRTVKSLLLVTALAFQNIWAKELIAGEKSNSINSDKSIVNIGLLIDHIDVERHIRFSLVEPRDEGDVIDFHAEVFSRREKFELVSKNGFFGPSTGKILFGTLMINNISEQNINIQIVHNWINIEEMYVYDISRRVDLKCHRKTYEEISGDKLTNRYLYCSIDLNPGITKIGLVSYSRDYVKGDFTLYNQRSLNNRLDFENSMFGILFGVVISFVLYTTIMWWSTRDKVYLYTCIYIFSYSIFHLHFVNIYHSITEYFGLSLYRKDWVLIYASFLGMASSFGMVRYFYYLDEIWPRYSKFMRYISLMTLSACFISGSFLEFSEAAMLVMVTNMIVTPILLFAVFGMAYKRYQPGYYKMMAWVMLGAGNIFQIMDTLGATNMKFWPQNGLLWGLSGMSVFVTIGLGSRTKYALKKLNDSLERYVGKVERIVEDKTRDIKTIMQSINQGIFTIRQSEKYGVGGIINKDYSKWLETYLEIEELAGKNIMEAVFQSTDISQDKKNVISATLSNALGDDVMNFEVNSHLLPRSFKLIKSGNVKYGEIDWLPIVNRKTDKVEKILVTIRDMSELNDLRMEAKSRREELEYIIEILNVKPEEYNKFVDMANHFVNENLRLLKCNDTYQKEYVELIFINIHTLKGISRKYGFDTLTNILHDVEDRYAQHRQTDGKDWDKFEAIKTQKAIERVIKKYENISEHKLGRHRNADCISLEKKFIEEKNAVLKRMILEGVSGSDYKDVCSLIQKIDDALLHSMTEVREDLERICLTLAKKLGKEMPRIIIEGSEVLYTDDGYDLLNKILIHLVRNSMDHGIEKRDERLAKNKELRGRIWIQTKKTLNGIIITTSDDGKGLDIEKIREKGIKNGLCSKNMPLTINQTADMLFEHGVSTAESVSEISGRGVGMGAVKLFVENAGGRFQINIKEPICKGLYNFEFEFYLPEKYVRVPLSGCSPQSPFFRWESRRFAK